MTQLLREKLNKALGDRQRQTYLFLRLSFKSSPRTLLSHFRHYCSDYDYKLSKGGDRETEWLKQKNNLLEILLVLQDFQEEILNSVCPQGFNWFQYEKELFAAHDIGKLIKDIIGLSIVPVYSDQTDHEAVLNKRLFIQYMTSRYSIGVDQIKTWMSSAVDQRQFTPEMAKEICDQWDKHDPNKYGDPFGLWDILSRKAEYQFVE